MRLMRIAMNVMLNVSVWSTASKRTLLKWWIVSDDHLAITLANFLCEKYLLAE